MPIRTVTFRSVYESILRRMGYDPLGDSVKEDVGLNVLQHLNDRVRFAWPIWDWPELNVVEWRAFRQLWNNTETFVTGTEFYYFGIGVADTLPDPTVDPPAPGEFAGYYTTLTTAPIGTLPTNIIYFSPLDPVDRYIDYAQFNQNVIGDMLDVYGINPRTVRRTHIIGFSPSSKGIDVRTSMDVVWIRYRIPVSQFTLDPAMAGNNAQTSFYDFSTGQCFYGTGQPLSGSPVLIPFPQFLAGYVRAAAYADAILETTMEAQTRLSLASAAMNEAMEYLQREIDNLAAQGQRVFYPAFPPSRRPYRRSTGVAVGAIPTI